MPSISKTVGIKLSPTEVRREVSHFCGIAKLKSFYLGGKEAFILKKFNK